MSIKSAYSAAKDTYAFHGVNTDAAIAKLKKIPVSVHCWQGDDVTGFEGSGSLDGGLMATGNYPGKARNGDELRSDADFAFSLAAGKHRFNLHAKYAETAGERVDRDALKPLHFSRWMDWAKSRGLGLDFNPTYFSHPKAASGFTLSSADEGIRRFWVEHGIACRQIAEAMGKKLNNPCVHNIWIPDGWKDEPADRKGPRERLKKSLDAMLKAKVSRKFCLDAVEGKLFGIGSESYVSGSHEFYLAYAAKNNIMITLDTGHYHPTESCADKISSVLSNLDRVLVHVSRGIRWDSDHVVTNSDETRMLMREIVVNGYLDRVFISLDYFDASINRIAAWVIGLRNAQKALLSALLEPAAKIKKLEAEGDLSGRLALIEEARTLPLGPVWEMFCEKNNVPAGDGWMKEVKKYEIDVLNKRG